MGPEPVAPMCEASMAPVPKLHSSLTECLLRASPEKKCTKGPYWVQPPVFSARLELGRVLLPVAGGLLQCIPQFGTVTIGALDPGKVAS